LYKTLESPTVVSQFPSQTEKLHYETSSARLLKSASSQTEDAHHPFEKIVPMTLDVMHVYGTCPTLSYAHTHTHTHTQSTSNITHTSGQVLVKLFCGVVSLRWSKHKTKKKLQSKLEVKCMGRIMQKVYNSSGLTFSRWNTNNQIQPKDFAKRDLK